MINRGYRFKLHPTGEQATLLSPDVNMLKTKISPIWYLIFILPLMLMAGCGYYDTPLRYKTEASTVYRLKITSEALHQSSVVIEQMFMEEGFNHTFYFHHGHPEGPIHVETYAFHYSSGKITIKLLHDEVFKRAIVAIYPARLNSISSKRRSQLKEHEEAILRIGKKLEQTDSFAEYVPSEWERAYLISK